MNPQKKIVILFSEVSDDAKEDEQDTLIQVEMVSKALSTLGYEPIPLAFTSDLPKMAEHFRKISPDMVFNLVESVHNQGRLIYLAPALMEALKIPYTGADADAMFLTSNKLLAKKMLYLSGVDTPRWFCQKDLNKENLLINGTFIVKSVWEHASIGLAQDSIVCIKNSAELKHLTEAFQDRLGGQCFAEEYIEGREFNLSVLDGEVLYPAEIRFMGYSDKQFRIVDYNAKWKEDSSEFHNTVRSFEFLPEDNFLLDRLKDITIQCWNIFELCGYARVDFRVDSTGRPFVLEVNANPCLSPDAGFAAALEKAGISYKAAIEKILKRR